METNQSTTGETPKPDIYAGMMNTTSLVRQVATQALAAFFAPEAVARRKRMTDLAAEAFKCFVERMRSDTDAAIKAAAINQAAARCAFAAAAIYGTPGRALIPSCREVVIRIGHSPDVIIETVAKDFANNGRLRQIMKEVCNQEREIGEK